MSRKDLERGASNPLLIASIILGIFAALATGGFIWAYGNYVDQRDNTNAKVEKAVTEAKKEQSMLDEKDYLERAKQPYNQLVGPDDLGHVTFSYPKTWSVYETKRGQEYEAYLYPGIVPTVSGTQPYATRVNVDSEDYESAVRGYMALVKKGDLKSTPITVNNFTGVRLDGKFSPTRTGSAVVFKVRDKTLTIATDADAFRADFDSVIVKSLDFNP